MPVDLCIDIVYSPGYSQPMKTAFIMIPEFVGFGPARRGTGRNRGSFADAILERTSAENRGPSPAVENFECLQFFYRMHFAGNALKKF